MYKELETLINNRINQEATYPELVTITKVHDTTHVDCKNEMDDPFKYIPVIGTPVKNNTGLMFTLADGTFIIITKW